MAEYGFLVVAHHLDGRLVKGLTRNFRADHPLFQVQEEGQTGVTVVSFAELKGVFFVKTLDGDPEHRERKSFRDRKGIGKKVWVEFRDGECLAGWTLSLVMEKLGFFLFPTDANSNLEKVFVLHSAVKRVLLDEAAEKAAAEHGKSDEHESDHAPVRPDHWEDFLQPLSGDSMKSPARAEPQDKTSRKRTDSGIFLGDW
jgi:hypothetical protein